MNKKSKELIFLNKKNIKLILKHNYRKFYWIFLEKPAAHLFYFLPIKKNRIVFDNFGGKGFGGNPKYIAEAINQKNKYIDMVWLVDNMSEFVFPEYIRQVKIDTLHALYIRATSKVWIDNVRHRHPMKKKKHQIYLQTWHGSMSAKKVERDAEELLPKSYVKEAKYDGAIMDAILADNSLQEQSYRRAFWLSKDVEILRFGFPQNDIVEIEKNDENKKSFLKKKLSIDSSCYYVLYAPTFRDDFSTKGYNIDFEKVVEAFENKMKRPTKIIVRLHPNVAFQKKEIKFSDFVLDGTDYPSVQELALVCDAVISDYSSTLFDFSNLNKPAFICALDYDEYQEKRGFNPEFFEFPFSLAKSNLELIENITLFDDDKYKMDLNDFYKKYPVYGDGHASENTAEWIIKHMNI